MVCIAALGLARDVGALNVKANAEGLRAFTDTQNKLILKYAYSKQLNQHVEVRKQYLLQTEEPEAIVKRIEECSK